MRADKLIVLGLSEPTLTMILDNLESCGRFPDVVLVNNLARADLAPFGNPRFRVDTVTATDAVDFSANAFLGVNKPGSKRAVFEHFKACSPAFTTIVHRASAISSTATLGRGVHINSLVSIAAFARLGDFVSINRNASVGHHADVGDFVTINPGANIAGFARIGAHTLVGMGVNVMDGLEIGAHTIVGAGSLVTKSLPSGVVAYGNPCRVVRDNEAQPV